MSNEKLAKLKEDMRDNPWSAGYGTAIAAVTHALLGAIAEGSISREAAQGVLRDATALVVKKAQAVN